MGTWLLLGLIIHLVAGGVSRWDETVLPGQVLKQQTGMFNNADNPLEGTNFRGYPYVKWDFMVIVDPVKSAATQQKSLPVLEMVFLHHSLKNEIGLYDSLVKGTEYCCTQTLYAIGGCDKVNTLLVKNLTYLQTEVDSKLFYLSIPGTAFSRDGFARSNQTIFIRDTGMWYFFVANCDESTTQINIQLSGSMIWKNPYGYLPGQIATKLPVYWVLSLCWLILLIAYVILCVRFSKNLMGLQYAILVVISISLVEQLIWSGGFVFYNFNGWSNTATISVGAFFTALKMTAIRCLLLLVALGLSVTRVTLSPGLILAVVLITVSYFGFRVVYDYHTVSFSSGHVSPSLFGVLSIGIGMLVTNIIFFGWIVLATYVTMTQLEEKKQTNKAQQYQKLGILLIVALALSAIIVLLQGGVETMTLADEYFKWWWAFDAYWQFVYFACVLSVAMIWKPNPQNSAYAYSTQLSQDDDTEILNADELKDLPVDNDQDMDEKKTEPQVPLDIIKSESDDSQSFSH